MNREQLCNALKTRSFLYREEIDAIFADREFFQPYLRNALAQRAKIGTVPEYPIDVTDVHAIFFLADFGDETIIPDVINCLKMDNKDLMLLYGDLLIEHMWIPVAKVGHSSLDLFWEFITDTSYDIFTRYAVVEGIIALHHFHPGLRTDTIKFIEKLLNRSECFPIDHLAGILCHCAGGGLMELRNEAEEFANFMDADGDEYLMANADDIREAFIEGPIENFISGRANDVYIVNKEWKQMVESWQEEDENQIMPEWLKEHTHIVDKVKKSILFSINSEDEVSENTVEFLKEQYELSNQLSTVLTTEERLYEFEEFIDYDITEWLLELPFELAQKGKVREAVEIGRIWANVTEPENFLGDRAVILAEAGWKEDAHKQITENFQIFPNDAWIRIKAGDAYSALGENEEAERCYRQALSMSDDEYDREGVLERFIPMLRKLGKNEEADNLEAEEKLRKGKTRGKVDSEFGMVQNTYKRTSPKIGRNEPCPCGSGKKYKKCCGG